MTVDVQSAGEAKIIEALQNAITRMPPEQTESLVALLIGVRSPVVRSLLFEAARLLELKVPSNELQRFREYVANAEAAAADKKERSDRMSAGHRRRRDAIATAQALESNQRSAQLPDGAEAYVSADQGNRDIASTSIAASSNGEPKPWPGWKRPGQSENNKHRDDEA